MDRLIDHVREMIEDINPSETFNMVALANTTAYFEANGLTIEQLEQGDEQVVPSHLVVFTVYDVYKFESLTA